MYIISQISWINRNQRTKEYLRIHVAIGILLSTDRGSGREIIAPLDPAVIVTFLPPAPVSAVDPPSFLLPVIVVLSASNGFSVSSSLSSDTTTLDKSFGHRLQAIRLRRFAIRRTFLNTPKSPTLFHDKCLGYLFRGTRLFSCQSFSHVCGLRFDKECELRCFTRNLWGVADSFGSIAFAPWDFDFDELALASSTAVLNWIYTSTVTLYDRLAVRSGASLETIEISTLISVKD